MLPLLVCSTLLSIDPLLGAVGFSGKNLGEWSVVLEHEVRPRHAIVVEQTTVHVHDDPFHLTVLGLGAGYRYYPRGDAGPFLGAIAGGKVGTGRHGEAPMRTDLGARAVFAVGHAGWRWTRGNWVVTVRAGLGIARYQMRGTINDQDIDVAADDALAPLPVEIDSELSVGFSF